MADESTWSVAGLLCGAGMHLLRALDDLGLPFRYGGFAIIYEAPSIRQDSTDYRPRVRGSKHKAARRR